MSQPQRFVATPATEEPRHAPALVGEGENRARACAVLRE